VRIRPARITTGVVLWLVAAAAATTVGLFAVGAIGTDIFGASARQPLSPSDVDSQLAQSPPATTTTPPPSSAPSTTTTTRPPAATPPPARTQVFHSAGGTVWARCAPGGVEVVASTPAQGYDVDSENEGIDDHPHVQFRSGDQRIEVRMRCVGGTVQPEITSK
jgi:hypothetical protein